MGNKGDKISYDSVISAESLVKRLRPIGNVTSKKMFGGHGIFHKGKMFSIIDSKGGAFLKVNDTNVDDFKAFRASQHSKMPYYCIPTVILEQTELLEQWARKSIAISK